MAIVNLDPRRSVQAVNLAGLVRLICAEGGRSHIVWLGNLVSILLAFWSALGQIGSGKCFSSLTAPPKYARSLRALAHAYLRVCPESP